MFKNFVYLDLGSLLYLLARSIDTYLVVCVALRRMKVKDKDQIYHPLKHNHLVTLMFSADILLKKYFKNCGEKFVVTNDKGEDQPVHPHSLISAFLVCATLIITKMCYIRIQKTL